MPAERKTKTGRAPARRKRRSTEEVVDRIIAAAEAEFELCGYVGATMAAIARRAEVTEAQIFRYFDSKQDLFRAAIFSPLNRHFSEFNARNIADAGKSRTRREMEELYISELLDFIEQHSRMFMSLAVASAYNADSTDGVSDMEGLRAYFDRGAAMMKTQLRADSRVDPKLMVRVSFAAVLACVMFKDWLFPRGMSAKAVREAIAAFVIDGISGDEQPEVRK